MRTAHRRLAAAGLACLLEHLGNEALAPTLLRRAGRMRNRRRGGRSRPSLKAATCPIVRSTRLPCIGAVSAPSRHGGEAAAPRHPHVQTGFRRGRQVPRPLSCLPPLPPLSLPASAAWRRCAACSQLPMANAPRPQAGRVRGKTPARWTAAPRQREVRRMHLALHARRHGGGSTGWTRLMARQDARQRAANRRPSWACSFSQTGCATPITADALTGLKYRLSNDAGLVTLSRNSSPVRGGGIATQMAAAGPAVGRQRRPKARRRCERHRQRCTPPAARRAHALEQRNARRQVATLRSQRGGVWRQRNQDDAVGTDNGSAASLSGPGGSTRYQPTATLSDGQIRRGSGARRTPRPARRGRRRTARQHDAKGRKGASEDAAQCRQWDWSSCQRLRPARRRVARRCIPAAARAASRLASVRQYAARQSMAAMPSAVGVDASQHGAHRVLAFGV